MNPKLGIVAGGGTLPGVLIAACRESQRPFFVLAIEGQADRPTVAGHPHAWVRLGEIGRAIALLREAGVEEIVMAGAIRRPSLGELRPDARGMLLIARAALGRLGDDGLLRALIAELEEREGFRVVGAQAILPSLLARPGVHGIHRPDAEARADIARGVAVIRGLGQLDVGQAVVVQQGLVLAVEAIEGTDAMIDRTAGLRRPGPGGVLVKIKKPGQEERADLPTIGATTVERTAAAGLRGIAIEAGGVLVIDPEAVRRAADAAGLFLIGIDPAADGRDG